MDGNVNAMWVDLHGKDDKEKPFESVGQTAGNGITKTPEDPKAKETTNTVRLESDDKLNGSIDESFSEIEDEVRSCN